MSAWRIISGDCLDVLPALPMESVDAVVTDPPYGLEFMGAAWDSPARMTGGATWGGRTSGVMQLEGGHARGYANHDARLYGRWSEAWAREAFRVLKPGGHLVAMGGTRTYHRLASGIEDAGFTVRDCLAWLYGSGFPKSMDVAKAMDRAAGAEREVVGDKLTPDGRPVLEIRQRAEPARADREGWGRPWRSDPEAVQRNSQVTAPATDQARTWSGWGTALKPAFEPIVLARKPFAGSVVENVLVHGTGALNIDAARVPMSDGDREVFRDVAANFDARDRGRGAATRNLYGGYTRPEGREALDAHPEGRFPANVVVDQDAADAIDAQSGVSVSQGGRGTRSGLVDNPQIYGEFSGENVGENAGGLQDAGGASRFFYCAKADRAERDNAARWDSAAGANLHPTVKPVALMVWLVRLVTPPGGTVLDPFAGSGTTGLAARRLGFDFIGIEREEEYADIARARIRGDGPLFNVD